MGSCELLHSRAHIWVVVVLVGNWCSAHNTPSAKSDSTQRGGSQATTPVRNQITTKLVKHYVDKKDLARAEALLSQLADEEEYPFSAAADLLLAMGPEQSADRMTIFNQALNNFEQYSNSGSLGTD